MFFESFFDVLSEDPDPVSSVGRFDTASWNNKRLRGVTLGFQVKTHIIECHIDEATNVFDNDPRGFFVFNNFMHVRPEVSIIFLSFLLTCDTERLTGDASTDEVELLNNSCWVIS
tara:strand:- start:205 stop:549 length:345 start_codon:yes stop_codon:yes gene_type:complete